MKMEISLVHTTNKLKHLFLSSCSKLASLFFLLKSCLGLLSSYLKQHTVCSKLASIFFLLKSCLGLLSSYLKELIVFRLNPFWIQLHYFIIISSCGYLALKLSKPRTAPEFRPKDLDLIFTSVSAATVSSMLTVEMEVFSSTQLVVLTLLMLLGGEVFTSLLQLQLTKLKFTKNDAPLNKVDSIVAHSDSLNQVELGLINLPQSEDVGKPNPSSESGAKSLGSEDSLKRNSIRYLGFVVLWYLIVAHLGGFTFISLYLNLVPTARQVLKSKALSIPTFAAFLTVSTFSNGGFVPINESMMVFVKNSGLLLILIPLVFAGNTMFAPCLRLAIWALGKATKRREFGYMLRNGGELGYDHLLSRLHATCLAATVAGFVAVPLAMFCVMEWSSSAMAGGLSSYQKIVAALFQVVNSRHTGEVVVDLSLLAPAILVLFIVLMYLPPYTSIFPTGNGEKQPENEEKKRRKAFVGNALFSQLGYLVIFIILICITERQKLEEDPLNFSVLNITLEVVSAYGNVGFSTGYSCNRRLTRDGYCEDKWFGFVGRWSNKGKLILILVMFFGRIKKFSKEGGTAWKLS